MWYLFENNFNFVRFINFFTFEFLLSDFFIFSRLLYTRADDYSSGFPEKVGFFLLRESDSVMSTLQWRVFSH